MKKLFLLPLLLISTIAAAQGPWQVFQQMIRLPMPVITSTKATETGQVVLQHYGWHNPALGSGITILTTQSSTTAGKTFTSFLHTLDFPRNIVISFSGTTASIASGNIVTTGTNIYGKTITETTAITDNTTKTGATAFNTLTSIAFPATNGVNGDVLYTVVAGAKLGVDRCSDNAGDYVFSEYGGVYDSTRGTYAVDSTHVELNTFTDNSALDGAHDVLFNYLHNYRCFGN